MSCFLLGSLSKDCRGKILETCNLLKKGKRKKASIYRTSSTVVYLTLELWTLCNIGKCACQVQFLCHTGTVCMSQKKESLPFSWPASQPFPLKVFIFWYQSAFYNYKMQRYLLLWLKVNLSQYENVIIAKLISYKLFRAHKEEINGMLLKSSHMPE